MLIFFTHPFIARIQSRHIEIPLVHGAVDEALELVLEILLGCILTGLATLVRYTGAVAEAAAMTERLNRGVLVAERLHVSMLCA